MTHDRRKEPPFPHKYFSGLNWLEAEKYVGKMMEFSTYGEVWCGPYLLDSLRIGPATIERFKSGGESISVYPFCRTCPETFKDPHPTIRITVNGKDYDLPKPRTEVLLKGTRYWICNFILNEINTSRWSGDDADRRRLLNGIIHLTEARAKAWADWWKEIHR
jgi:hypothetical protein